MCIRESDLVFQDQKHLPSEWKCTRKSVLEFQVEQHPVVTVWLEFTDEQDVLNKRRNKGLFCTVDRQGAKTIPRIGLWHSSHWEDDASSFVRIEAGYSEILQGRLQLAPSCIILKVKNKPNLQWKQFPSLHFHSHGRIWARPRTRIKIQTHGFQSHTEGKGYTNISLRAQAGIGVVQQEDQDKQNKMMKVNAWGVSGASQKFWPQIVITICLPKPWRGAKRCQLSKSRSILWRNVE